MAARFCSQGGHGRENDGGTIGEKVCMEENTEGKTEPELGELESSSAGTGFEAPGQQCLSNWEFGFGGNHFFPRRTRYRDASTRTVVSLELGVSIWGKPLLPSKNPNPHQKTFVKR